MTTRLRTLLYPFVSVMVQRVLWKLNRLEDLPHRLPQLCMRRLEGRTHLLLEQLVQHVSAPSTFCRVVSLVIVARRHFCHVVQGWVVRKVAQESRDRLERFLDLFGGLSCQRDVFLVPRLDRERVEVVAEDLDIRLCERVKVRLGLRVVLVVALELVGQANNGPASLVRVDVHNMVFVRCRCDVEKVLVCFVWDKLLFDVDCLRGLHAFECILRALTPSIVTFV